MVRVLTVLAAVLLIGAVACSAESDLSREAKLERLKGLVPRFVSKRTFEAGLKGKSLANIIDQRLGDGNRDRVLAETTTVCGSLKLATECEALSKEAACAAKKGCDWDVFDEKCELDTSPADEPFSNAYAIGALYMLGSDLSCPDYKTKADCEAKATEVGCAWTDSRTPKCHSSEAHMNAALNEVKDYAANDMMKLVWECGSVIGDDKTKCDANKDCKYVSAASNNNSTSGRKLLGGGTGNTCEPTDKAEATVIAHRCPAEFKSIKDAATGETKTMMEGAEKAAAEKATMATSTASTVSSMFAAAVVAATFALLAL